MATDKKSVNSETSLMYHPNNYRALNICEEMKAIVITENFHSKHTKNLK